MSDEINILAGETPKPEKPSVVPAPKSTVERAVQYRTLTRQPRTRGGITFHIIEVDGVRYQLPVSEKRTLTAKVIETLVRL